VPHPRPTTANPTRNPQSCASDQAYDRSGIRAALEAASSARPEPLTQPIDAEQRPQVSAGSVADWHTVLEYATTKINYKKWITSVWDVTGESSLTAFAT
jgi:hypothetical protein